MGNVARRLLESFLRFKRPKLAKWRDALDSIVDALPSDAIPGLERLHYALDDESHLQRFDFDTRDYSEVVLTDVRSALALIKAADPEHFDGMCGVVGLTPAL